MSKIVLSLREMLENQAGDYQKIDCEEGNSVAYTREFNNMFVAYCFYGKRTKTDLHVSAPSVESRQKQIDAFFKKCKAKMQLKKQLRAERISSRNLKVGDILYTSWGHEQTNIDFYQVTQLIGTKSVMIREISSSKVPNTGNDMSGKVVAVPNSFKGKEIRKVVNGESLVINDNCANKWGSVNEPGNAVFYSSYY